MMNLARDIQSCTAVAGKGNESVLNAPILAIKAKADDETWLDDLADMVPYIVVEWIQHIDSRG